MLLQLFIFCIGLAALYYGAEWLIKGASGLALRFGIRRMVVGLTVVALGTSMPEFLVNFMAAMWNEQDLALGNIVGSNICNIGLILGVSALIFPLRVRPATLRKEYPMMMLAMSLFFGMSLDGEINRLDGVIMVIGLLAFFVFLVLDGRSHESKQEVARERAEHETAPSAGAEHTLATKLLLLIGGILGLTLGARLMVMSAIQIAELMGISHLVIGVTVVAVGTSLPELAASALCAFRKEADLSLGNVLGSNLLNVLFVVGLVALIRPMKVEIDYVSIHFYVMLGFGLLLLPLAWTEYRISRLEGGMLLASFIGYLVYVSLAALSSNPFGP